MADLNTCSLNDNRQNGLVFPARIFGYLATCENLKRKIGNLRIFPSHTNGLPFVSSFTNRVSPQGVICCNWAFLKY